MNDLGLLIGPNKSGGQVIWWWLRPILVFSLSLSQAKQNLQLSNDNYVESKFNRFTTRIVEFLQENCREEEQT